MMSETEALTGVYPNFADAPTRLVWNREREEALKKALTTLPVADGIELLLKITQRRIAILSASGRRNPDGKHDQPRSAD